MCHGIWDLPWHWSELLGMQLNARVCSNEQDQLSQAGLQVQALHASLMQACASQAQGFRVKTLKLAVDEEGPLRYRSCSLSPGQMRAPSPSAPSASTTLLKALSGCALHRSVACCKLHSHVGHAKDRPCCLCSSYAQ